MLAALRRSVREGPQRSNAQARKALLRMLVAEIVVESRNTIRPFFKVPTLTSAVGFQRTFHNANHQPALVEGPTVHL